MKLKLLFTVLVILISSLTFAQVANQPSDYVLCDNDFPYNDGQAEFDLTIKDVEVLQGQSPNDFVVTYHNTLTQANNGTGDLSSPFTNIINPQTIWVRIEELSSGNFDTTTLTLIVSEMPLIADTDIYTCDEDNDGEVVLNLSDTENGYNISYYLTESDAEQSINGLLFPMTFQAENIPNQLYARADSTNGCFYVVPRALYFGSGIVANSLTPYETCGVNGIGQFYLPHKNDEATGGSPLTVSYHLTESDAENGINSLPFNYTNISNPQNIYVSVRNIACSDVTSLELIVNEGDFPQINSLPAESLCPDNPGVVDLTSYENQLINDSINFEFSYYYTQADMTQDINDIIDPTALNFTIDLTEIFVKITNSTNNCYGFTSLYFDFNGPCTVPCDVGINKQYCYTNEDESFVYVSSDGNPLILEFNAGSIYANGLTPYIRVFDSDGSTIYTGSGTYVGNQIRDLSDLIFQSSGDSITLEINVYNNSDGCNVDIPEFQTWDFDVYCSTSAGVINAQAFSDYNFNTTFDSGETEFSNGYFTYEKNNDGVINTIYSPDGSFFIVPENETDTYDIIFYLYDEYLACYDVTVSSFNNISVDVGQNIQLDVPITTDEICEDLSVSLINYEQPPRPGFNYTTDLVFENEGFVDIPSGMIIFQSDLLVDFISVEANPNYTITNTGQGFLLEFSNLQPGEIISATIQEYCPASVSLGTILTSYASYSTNDNDVYTENDYSQLSLEVVGSYDPNDKIESHGPKIVYYQFAASYEWLYYTIRFQNLGTAAAEFVRIEDMLDSQLDQTTFQMLRSSHDYVVTRTNNNIEWYFEDINLPAEQDDAEGSNGYVYYRIKPQPGYAIGDIIPNTASIFFDFNAPVITNTFETEFVEDLLSISEFDLSGFNMYPTPANDVLNIKLNNMSNANISIYDIQGKLVFMQSLTETQYHKLNISDLQSGMYFVKLNTSFKELVKKLVIE